MLQKQIASKHSEQPQGQFQRTLDWDNPTHVSLCFCEAVNNAPGPCEQDLQTTHDSETPLQWQAKLALLCVGVVDSSCTSIKEKLSG